MYDIISNVSYERVKRSLINQKDDFPNDDLVIILVGNKYDLHYERAVTTNEAMKLASMYQSVCTYPCCV